MSKYILKRVLISILTLAAIIFVLFLMLDFMPGSPFNDEKLTAAQKALLYTKYGLDKPFFIRFLKYLFAMMKGDLGSSYVLNKNKASLSKFSNFSNCRFNRSNRKSRFTILHNTLYIVYINRIYRNYMAFCIGLDFIKS